MTGRPKPGIERKELLVRIAAEEARVVALESERGEAQRCLDALRDQLSCLPDDGPVKEPTKSNSEKVALFRSLFRGRPDVFPKLWRNARSGKEGYAPACANEWGQGVCDKPKVKCGECPNQAFHSVSDDVVLDHLWGRHTIGVYPLLPDETCWFLAMDFDQEDWKEDIAALRPGHHAARGFRQPYRAAVSIRAPATGQLGVRAGRLVPASGSVGVPGRPSSSGALAGAADRAIGFRVGRG